MEKESLTKLAYAAGFSNLHDMAGLSTWLIGSIMSDDYEILYFKGNGDLKTNPRDEGQSRRRIIDNGTVDIFAVKDQYDHETCAIFRLSGDRLLKKIGNRTNEPMNGSVGLDSEKPLYVGAPAVAILKSLKEKLTK